MAHARWIAGIDGCPAGWIVVLRALDSAAWRIAVHPDIEALLAAEPGLVAIAVDMPIGLPDRIAGPGRPAEQAVRKLLGKRASSVFSMPARPALDAATHEEAKAMARRYSEPSRAISAQGFNILAKVRELDSALRSHPGLCERLIETHPEVIFRLLKGESLGHPKKSREGCQERMALLASEGIASDLLTSTPPRGAKHDDLVDAIACSIVAARHAFGLARPYPDPFPRDAYGLPIAIWM